MLPTDTLETKKRREKLTREERNARRKASIAKSNAKKREADPDYWKRRMEAIKAGNWTPRRKAAATPLPDVDNANNRPPWEP